MKRHLSFLQSCAALAVGLLVCVSFARTAAAQAASAPPQIRFVTAVAAVDRVARGKGPLTRGEYDAFWARLGVSDLEFRSRVAQELRKSVVLLYQYNLDKHRCALRAWETARMVACPDADRTYSAIRAWQNSVGADSTPMIRAHEAFVAYLQASAERGIFSSEGRPQQVSEAGLRGSLLEAQAIVDRLESVLKPSFHETEAKASPLPQAPR